MSDFYTEQLIKKQSNGKDKLVKILMILIAAFCVLMAPVIPLGWVVAALAIAAVVFLMGRMDIEYEYMYINGDMDVDVIYRKAKRKRVFSVNVSELELLAPLNSIELKPYQKLKTFDYSSGSRDRKLYGMIVSRNGEKARIIFEPNETIVEGFFIMAPRKVIRN